MCRWNTHSHKSLHTYLTLWVPFLHSKKGSTRGGKQKQGKHAVKKANIIQEVSYTVPYVTTSVTAVIINEKFVHSHGFIDEINQTVPSVPKGLFYVQADICVNNYLLTGKLTDVVHTTSMERR